MKSLNIIKKGNSLRKMIQIIIKIKRPSNMGLTKQSYRIQINRVLMTATKRDVSVHLEANTKKLYICFE